MKDKYVHVYQNEIWKLEDEHILEELVDRYMGILIEKYNELKPELRPLTIKDFEELIDKYECGEYYTPAKKRIKLMLYNTREFQKIREIGAK